MPARNLPVLALRAHFFHHRTKGSTQIWFNGLSDSIWHCEHRIVCAPEYPHRVWQGKVKAAVALCMRMSAPQLSS